MGAKIPILDAGYLQLIETWGSDERIIESARMSTDKGFQGWGPKPCPGCSVGTLVWGTGCKKCEGTGKVPGDEKLLAHLWANHHTTPFEMAGMTIEVQAPIMVFREWQRHRTQSYNELSARYTELPDLFYIPSAERLMAAKQSTTNKQGSETGFTAQEAEQHAAMLEMSYAQARAWYEDLLKRGVAREIARLVIPVAQYSRMRASGNLWNWLRFLTLRTDPKAQWEIRQFATTLLSIVHQQFPRTAALFDPQ